MNNTFDLQIQSTASDGKHTPREIVIMAKDLGLNTIAITDHDTVAGVSEALVAGAEFGVQVIAGIEMSVEEYQAHVLGFGLDIQNQALLYGLEESRALRLSALREMMELLKKNEGFIVDWEDILNDTPDSKTITRLHIVRAIMKRPENKEKLAGVTKHQFFERYFADNGPNYIHRKYRSLQDTIALIHGAGGAAVWSHPIIPDFKSRNYEDLEEALKQFIKWGIDGIEVFNPSHTEDDAEFLQSLAGQYSLLRTAGSDFHEKGDHPADPKTGLHSARALGDYETHGFDTSDIVEQLMQIIQKR